MSSYDSYAYYFNWFSKNKYGNTLDFVKLILPDEDYQRIVDSTNNHIDYMLRQYNVRHKASYLLNDAVLNEQRVFKMEDKYYRYSKTILKSQLDDKLKNIHVVCSKNEPEFNFDKKEETIFGVWENGTLRYGKRTRHVSEGEWQAKRLKNGKKISLEKTMEGEWKDDEFIEGKITENGIVSEGKWSKGVLTKGRIVDCRGRITYRD